MAALPLAGSDDPGLPHRFSSTLFLPTRLDLPALSRYSVIIRHSPGNLQSLTSI